MGWKNVKEHYRIEHQVQVRAGRICIGSPYISEIIVIGADGMLDLEADPKLAGLKHQCVEIRAETSGSLDYRALMRQVPMPETMRKTRDLVRDQLLRTPWPLPPAPRWPRRPWARPPRQWVDACKRRTAPSPPPAFPRVLPPCLPSCRCCRSGGYRPPP